MLTKNTSTLLALFVACAPFALADDRAVESRVFSWEGAKVEKTRTGEVRHILEGRSLDLTELEVNAFTIAPGESAHLNKTHDEEELVIIKSGKLDITIADKVTTLGPGSVAVFVPGESHGIANHRDAPATFFLFEYKAVSAADHDRAAAAGGSFVVDWDKVEYRPSDIGGRRNLYDRPTAMFSGFEMHVSTLNAGLTNHATHTHRAEEMVLVIKGEVEMLIGENHYKAKAGDVYFIQSEIPHSLRNIGDGPTEYYAFQWR